MIQLEISGAGLGLKMRPRLGSINKLSLQHASFQPNSINEKRKTEKQMGESEMKHREISRCHRTDVYLLYLTLVTRGHNCGQAARVYLAHFVMAKSIFFLSSSLLYPNSLSLSYSIYSTNPLLTLSIPAVSSPLKPIISRRITVSKQLQTEEIRVKRESQS